MPKFIPTRNDHTFVDAHGVTIHYYSWEAAKPRGVVQLAHGLGEHALRYEHLASELVNAGYTLYANDHRGHGKTGLAQYDGDHSRLGRLGPGGLTAATDAIHQLTGIVRQEHRDIPIALLGHSWGSLMAQIILNKHAKDYDAVILTGTAYRTLLHMNSGNLNATHKHLGTTGYEWLSRDEKIAAAFVDDPLTFYANAAKLFGIVDGLRLLGRPGRAIAKDVPLLIMIGSEDPLGGVKSAELLASSYLKRSRLTDVELIVYTDSRHEVFNELNKDEVIADLIEWLDDRLPDAR